MKLEIRHLTKAFGGVRAIDDVSLAFPSGSLSAVIGPNGAGKTTFFNLISGAFAASSGEVLLDGRDMLQLSKAARMHRGIGRAFQVASCFPTMTVEENLMAAVTAHAASPTVGPGAAHAAIAVLAGVAAGTALAKSVGGAVATVAEPQPAITAGGRSQRGVRRSVSAVADQKLPGRRVDEVVDLLTKWASDPVLLEGLNEVVGRCGTEWIGDRR